MTFLLGIKFIVKHVMTAKHHDMFISAFQLTPPAANYSISQKNRGRELITPAYSILLPCIRKELPVAGPVDDWQSDYRLL